MDCEIPDIPEHMTYGDSLELNEKLLTVIENCNLDKAAIREIEQSRSMIVSKAGPRMSGLLSEPRVLPVGYLVHEAAAPQKTASFAIFIGTPPRVVTN
ncbi:hypothetical protein ACIP6T_10960 [Pantoea sp. NPDC088449]|uniref:Rz1-like lysis system protein LysC n=1 Tax=Pantoea sp. NPDC088449 TaxID=3364392 RepID=UPI00382D7D22